MTPVVMKKRQRLYDILKNIWLAPERDSQFSLANLPCKRKWLRSECVSIYKLKNRLRFQQPERNLHTAILTTGAAF